MQITSRARLTALLAVLVLPAACANEGATDSPGQEGTAEQGTGLEGQAVTKPAEQARKGRFEGKGMRGKGRWGGHHARGPAKLLLATASAELELSEAQQTQLAALKQSHRADKDAKREASQAKREAFSKAMAEVVRNGQVDPKLVDSQLAAMEELHAEHQAKQVALLDGLHALLEPAQRTQLVAAVKKRQSERAEKLKARAGAEGGDLERGKRGKFGPGKHGERGFGRMLGDLELSDAQRAELDALHEKHVAERPDPAQWEAMHQARTEQLERLLAAFEKEQFDAKSLDLGPGKRALAKEGIQRHLAHLAAMAKVLEPAQREKLAARFEAGPDSFRPKGLNRRGQADDAAEPGDELEADALEEILEDPAEVEVEADVAEAPDQAP